MQNLQMNVVAFSLQCTRVIASAQLNGKVIITGMRKVYSYCQYQ